MHRRLLLAVVLLAAPLLMAPESIDCPDCIAEDSGIVDGGEHDANPRAPDAGDEPALHADASMETSDSGNPRVVPGAVLVQEPVGCACSAVR